MLSVNFDERFATLSSLAYRVAYRVLGQREDAENVSQETLARAYARWRTISRYDEAWVARVATNLALGHLRKDRRTEGVAPRARDTTADVAGRLDLTDALRQLPKRQREVVTLRFIADLSEQDTAAALGCSTGAVKQHLHRAMRALRPRLTPDRDATGPTPMHSA